MRKIPRFTLLSLNALVVALKLLYLRFTPRFYPFLPSLLLSCLELGLLACLDTNITFLGTGSTVLGMARTGKDNLFRILRWSEIRRNLSIRMTLPLVLGLFLRECSVVQPKPLIGE